jgi:RNAse (barnase) inhibitor barstar
MKIRGEEDLDSFWTIIQGTLELPFSIKTFSPHF